MKALFRLGVAVLTAAITAIIAFFTGGEGASILAEIFGDAGIAGIVAALVAWGLGWAMSKLPQNDPA